MGIVRPYSKEDEKNVIILWRSCGLIKELINPNLDIERKAVSNKDLFLVMEKKDYS